MTQFYLFEHPNCDLSPQFKTKKRSKWKIPLIADLSFPFATGLSYFRTDYGKNDKVAVRYDNLPTNVLDLGLGDG